MDFWSCKQISSKAAVAFAVLLGGTLWFSTVDSARATGLPETIKASTVLTAAGGPYTGGWVYVPKGVTLTIEPGTVIKIWGSLSVEGTLNVNGTSEKPVVFTSIKDDTFGGDTNGDGSETMPAPGNWGALEFLETSAGSLHDLKILFAGLSTEHAAVSYQCPCGSPPSLARAWIAHGSSAGIKIQKGSPVILENTITENKGNGLNVTSGSPEIHENTISDNKAGIQFNVSENTHSSIDIEGNVIEGNTYFGIDVSAPIGYQYIDAASLGENEVIGNGEKAIIYEAFPNETENEALAVSPIPSNITTNTLSENGKNGIWVSGNITEPETWAAPGYALVVFGNGLAINKAATLTLEPGLVVKNEGPSIWISGILDANGNAEDPVTFTSIKDDTVAGDTNGDGAATQAKAGDWKGLFYPIAFGVELEFLGLRYAETALDIEFLSLLTIASSDFVHNKMAIDVSTTAELYPALAALPCVFPYQSFVFAYDDWFGTAGAPAPSINILEVVGTAVPSEFVTLLEAAMAFGPASAPHYGGENAIPFTIYSCPAAGIPAIPVTPVVPLELATTRHFPGP